MCSRISYAEQLADIHGGHGKWASATNDSVPRCIQLHLQGRLIERRANRIPARLRDHFAIRFQTGESTFIPWNEDFSSRTAHFPPLSGSAFGAWKMIVDG